MSRIIGSANRIADERFCAATVSRLSADVAQALWALIAEAGAHDDEDDDEPSFFTELKADPGKLGLETLLAEINEHPRLAAADSAAGLDRPDPRSPWPAPPAPGQAARRHRPRTNPPYVGRCADAASPSASPARAEPPRVRWRL